MLAASNGKGIDRHFLGLKLLLREDDPKPAIFNDKLFNNSCHWYSQVTSEYYEGFGWGEVSPDGYGVAYMVKNNSLHFNIVSLKLRNDHLAAYIHEALSEMRLVFNFKPSDKNLPALPTLIRY
jgi:carnitine O-acetyltransferase